MKQHIENTRRQLGELGAMAQKTEADERRILERAEAMLKDVEAGIVELRKAPMVGEAGDRYTQLIEERGRLHQVIGAAHASLS